MMQYDILGGGADGVPKTLHNKGTTPNLPEKFGRSNKIESLRYRVRCGKIVEIQLLIVDAELPLVPLDTTELLPPHFPQIVTSLKLLQGSHRTSQAPRE